MRRAYAPVARLVLLIGSDRIRLPVMAKIALHTAGATGGVPGSPMPPHFGPLLRQRWVSIFGASASRTIG